MGQTSHFGWGACLTTHINNHSCLTFCSPCYQWKCRKEKKNIWLHAKWLENFHSKVNIKTNFQGRLELQLPLPEFGFITSYLKIWYWAGKSKWFVQTVLLYLVSCVCWFCYHMYVFCLLNIQHRVGLNNLRKISNCGFQTDVAIYLVIIFLWFGPVVVVCLAVLSNIWLYQV